MNLVALSGLARSLVYRRWASAKDEASVARPITRLVSETTRVILSIAGPLTIDQVQGTRKSLEQAWRSNASKVLVDLSRCPMVDTAGVALLVSVLQRAQREGKEFSMRGVGPQIESLLQMLRLDGVFKLEREP